MISFIVSALGLKFDEAKSFNINTEKILVKCAMEVHTFTVPSLETARPVACLCDQ